MWTGVLVGTAGVTGSTKTCKNPITRAGLALGDSIIGRVAIDLLVVTRFPSWGPFPAVILAGPVPAIRSVGSSRSSAGRLVRHCKPLLVSVLSVGSIRPAFTAAFGTTLPHE